jgi:hypothetical protein
VIANRQAVRSQVRLRVRDFRLGGWKVVETILYLHNSA